MPSSCQQDDLTEDIRLTIMYVSQRIDRLNIELEDAKRTLDDLNAKLVFGLHLR